MLDRRRLFFEEKPTGVYTTLENVLQDIGGDFPELIAMEYLPWLEYTLDVLCRKGQTFCVVPRARKEMTGGITTRGVIAKDKNFDVIVKTSTSIVEGLGFSYNIGIQLKENAKGIPLLLEVNPRLQGTTVMSVASGINIPEQMVAMALGEFDYKQKFEPKWGLDMQMLRKILSQNLSSLNSDTINFIFRVVALNTWLVEFFPVQ